MTDNRLPKTVFCSDLEEGARFHGGQQKRYKDTLKANLKRCDIEPSELEELEHRIGPNGDRTARARSSSLKQIVSSHWKPSGYSGRHGHISGCQFPLCHLWTFLCIKDRAICASSYSSTNLSLLWSDILRVDGSVHHHQQLQLLYAERRSVSLHFSLFSAHGI